MKRIETRVHHMPEAKHAWRAALRADASNTFDDRVSEEIFDSEVEWAEVSILAQRMHQEAN